VIFANKEANEGVKVVKLAIAAALMVVVAGGTSGRLDASVCPPPSSSPAVAVPATRAAHARHGGVPRATVRRARPLVRHMAFCARHKHGTKRLALPAASRSCWPRRACGIEAKPVGGRHERAPSRTQLPRSPPLPCVHA
jgi:hypothetical protein